jgi:predicted metalloendopeptidase
MANNGIATDGKIIVNQPDYFKGLNKIIDSVSIDSWRHYLNWNLINTYANELTSEIVKQNFSFYGTVLSGTKEMKPRWKRSLGACDAAIGEIVGQVYVKKYFQADLKVKVNSMVKNILLAYKERISNLDWMSQETKVKALEKLAMFNTKLGYPDNWIDYTNLEVKTDAFVLNMMRAEKFSYQRMISRLGRPVDKSEWQMLPHQVNAYYDPTLNEIVFPAGIMQLPFFYTDADDATNYGALGAVIGHEITHGFDDQGSKYDGFGNLVEWWRATDRELFKKKSKMLVDCFNKYEALPGLFVNGELTLGENIADLGGLSTAYAAFKLNTKSTSSAKIEGYSPDERFFIAFSQVWKQNIKDETLRKRILTDSHSPANFRVLGTLSNMPEFYKTFGVVEGSKMYLNEDVRTKIW